MALVKCVECSRQISTLADACPHCGAPLHHSAVEEDTDSGRDTSGCILKLFLIVVVVGLIYLLGKKHIDPLLIKVKNKYFKQTEGSGSSEKENAPGILHRKSPEAKKADEETANVDPDMGKKITQNLLHPKEDTSKTTDDAKDADATTPAEAKPDDAPKADDKKEAVPEAKPVVDPKETTTDVVKPPVTVKPPVVETKPKDSKPVNSETPKVDRADALLVKANTLKLKIVAGMIEDANGMLIVIVNENWPILSNDQKKEAAMAVYKLWNDQGGANIEFRNKKQRTVATMNRSAKLIHGKMSFKIHEVK